MTLSGNGRFSFFVQSSVHNFTAATTWLMAESRSAIRSRNFFSVGVSTLSSDICLAVCGIFLFFLLAVALPFLRGQTHCTWIGAQSACNPTVFEAGGGRTGGGGGGVRGGGGGRGTATEHYREEKFMTSETFRICCDFGVVALTHFDFQGDSQTR